MTWVKIIQFISEFLDLHDKTIIRKDLQNRQHVYSPKSVPRESQRIPQNGVLIRRICPVREASHFTICLLHSFYSFIGDCEWGHLRTLSEGRVWGIARVGLNSSICEFYRTTEGWKLGSEVRELILAGELGKVVVRSKEDLHLDQNGWQGVGRSPTSLGLLTVVEKPVIQKIYADG